MDAGDTYLLIILLILLLFSSFFSSTETALMSVNKIKLRSLADGGNKRAALALDITENHTAKMLSAILIGNNIVNVSASSLATTLAYSFGGYMVSIATLILTVAILVFGEITPKNYATINAEKLTLRYIPVIKFFMTVMTPVIFIINLFSRGIMLILRVDPDAANKAMTEEELRTIVDVSHEDGVIEDNVVGIINMKDLLLYDHDTPFNIRDFLRKPHFTYEFKDISELLVEMRDSTFNIAIVLDEYGEMAGLITLEDILEEIVGEIHDEYDENEDELIKEISDHEYIIEGSMSLDDVNDHLHTELNSEDYDSLGGLIIEHLDRLPQMGDEVVTEDGIRLVVEKLDKNRVETVHVYLPERADTEEEEDEENSDPSETDKHSHE
ncbi:MAG: HlyC/CorC family transporter [Clostridiales bacterium]|nr:HlyC/CorC family transporter [Clostridiales bacterium]